jgi:hypothetical protein
LNKLLGIIMNREQGTGNREQKAEGKTSLKSKVSNFFYSLLSPLLPALLLPPLPPLPLLP